MTFKKGNKVRSKDHPMLKGEIVNIIVIPEVSGMEGFTDNILYELDWGGRYFEEEIELDKTGNHEQHKDT